jgi:hypothetical protein
VSELRRDQSQADSTGKLELSIESAVQRTVEALVNSGRPPERLVAVRRDVRPATGGPGGGSPATSWLAIDGEMGMGWYVGRFVWESAGEASSARLILTEGGSLLQGAQLSGRWDKKEDGVALRVRPGRYFAWLRRGVLAVDPVELELARCENEALGDLASWLLEIAAGQTSI